MMLLLGLVLGMLVPVALLYGVYLGGLEARSWARDARFSESERARIRERCRS